MLIPSSDPDVSAEESLQVELRSARGRFRSSWPFLFVVALAGACLLQATWSRGSARESANLRQGVESLYVANTHKAGLLTICQASQISLNVGMGPVKYDLGIGSGTTLKECPYGSPNAAGVVNFECSSDSDQWVITTHNCYQCEGEDVTVNFADGEEREVSLDFAEFGATLSQPCEFKDGKSPKTYGNGEILFRCGSHDWDLVLASCSDTKCPIGELLMLVDGGLKNFTVQGDDTARVKCPHGEGDMIFECVSTQKETVGEVYAWLLKENQCQQEMEFPVPTGFCPRRDATIHATKDFGSSLDKTMVISLNEAHEGDHEYPCPEGWPKGPEQNGTLLFGCQDGNWALKHLDCTGHEHVGQPVR